jgi:hypothetical protein
LIFATFFSYEGRIPQLELELLQTFQQSLNAQYANARLVILTDPTSAPQFKVLGFEPYPIPVTRGTLLLDRVRGLRSLLDTLDDGTLCVMLDFDMLVMKPFDFFDQDFEVAYTVRRQLNKQPLNGGVAIYRATRASKRILDRVIEDYQNLPFEQQQWWGDQISISNLFREKIVELKEGAHSFDGTSVLLLDAKKYNFTPYDMDVSPKTLVKNFFIDKSLADWIDEPLDDKYILHFKGPRKHLQIQVDWQIQNGEIYMDYLKTEFQLEASSLQQKGELHLRDLAQKKEKLWLVNDLCVLAILNSEKIFGDSSPRVREKLIIYLEKIGDFRGKVLAEKQYPITKL